MVVDIEDRKSLETYLKYIGKTGNNGDFKIELLTGGVSNKTVLLTWQNGNQWVVKQALDKLRVREDWFCDENRILTEYDGFRWFSKVLPEGTVPQVVFFDKEHHVLCMTAVPQPHENLRAMILAGNIKPELFKRLGSLLGMFQMAGKNDGGAISLFQEKKYFRDLRVEPFYQFTSTQLPEAKAFYDDLIEQTLNISETVSHGDYSPKNVLVQNGDVVLLDFEVTHYGDPAFDIGFFLCQMLCFANHQQADRQKIKEASLLFWTNYVQAANQQNPVMEKRSVHHTLGCLLARVKGRSPVDFLTKEEQHRQVSIALSMIKNDISRIPEMIDIFITNLETY